MIFKCCVICKTITSVETVEMIEDKWPAFTHYTIPPNAPLSPLEKTKILQSGVNLWVCPNCINQWLINNRDFR